MLYVLGHKNPDTDAICSAIAYAEFIKDTKGKAKAKAIMLGEPNMETRFVLEEAGHEWPEIATNLEAGSRIALVDHNEASQSIEDRHLHTIEALIDHHKIADFQTGTPLSMRVEPVGCTATILHEMFDHAAYIPSESVAMLMLSAVLSDTLHFRSPTTTARDKRAVHELAQLADIEDIEEYAMQMFDAKSDINHLDAKEIVTMDYKIFDFGGKNVGIGVMETTNPGFALERKDEFIQAMKEVKDQESLDYILLSIIDIFNEKNTTLVIDTQEEELIKKTFDITTQDGIADLGARVSRKKQIVPPLHDFFH